MLKIAFLEIALDFMVLFPDTHSYMYIPNLVSFLFELWLLCTQFFVCMYYTMHVFKNVPLTKNHLH